MRIVKNPGISALYLDGEYTLYDSTKRRHYDTALLAEPAFIWLLQATAELSEYDDVINRLSKRYHLEKETAKIEIDELLKRELLVSEHDSYLGETVSDRDTDWHHLGWADAFDYHLHTNCLPKIDWASNKSIKYDVNLMQSYTQNETAPPPYKELADSSRIPIHKVLHKFGRGLSDLLSANLANLPGSGVLQRDAFDWLVYLTFGQTSIRKLPVTGKHVAKTSPSGGSRHPTEAYVYARNVEGVAPGVYHYSVKSNSLELVQAGLCDEFFQSHVYLLERRPVFEPSVVILLTSVFERSMFRYRESRSYRVLHYDLGHLLQTFALLAAALNRPTYRSYTLRTSAVDSLLHLNSMEESAFAFVALA